MVALRDYIFDDLGVVSQVLAFLGSSSPHPPRRTFRQVAGLSGWSLLLLSLPPLLRQSKCVVVWTRNEIWRGKAV